MNATDEPNCQDCGAKQGTNSANCNTCLYMAGVLGFIRDRRNEGVPWWQRAWNKLTS